MRQDLGKKILSVLMLVSGSLLAGVAMAEATSEELISLQSDMVNAGEQHVQQLTAEACQACHQDIYEQWKGSMHANSSALKDPIHGAMYRMVAGDPRKEGVKTKKGKTPVCLNCHAPAAALEGSTKLDKIPVYNDGVTCVTCHSMETYKGTTGPDGKLLLGVKAYTFSDMLHGPSGRSLGPMAATTPGGEGEQGGFHPYSMKGGTAILRTSAACLGCHDQRNNSKGVPLCQTGSEFKDAGAYNCQQCHMPLNNGFADHSMAGGHVKSMVERAVVISLSNSTDGQMINSELVLQNTLPHKAPTGAPFRSLFVKISGIDAKGKVVWSNYKTHPMKEDPKSMMMLELLGRDGKLTSPPQAIEHGIDSRLKPHERRVINYQIPARDVVKVRAELFYDLLLPSLKKALQTVPTELKKSRLVGFAEVDV